MSYKNKIFVSFDGDSDIHYYRLMCAWKQNDSTNFDFNNAHNLYQSRDSSNEQTIKSGLQLRLRNSKIFVILIGENTRYLYKFVRWEIEQAIKRELPIIAVNLNKLRSLDDNRCPPILRNELVMHISYNVKIMQFALENWEQQFTDLKRKDATGPYYYSENIYKQLGL